MKGILSTEEISKIAVISNDDKRIQSIDLTKTYAHETSKDLVSEKEEIKCNNIIKQYKKLLTLMILQKKIQKNIIQIGLKFLIFLQILIIADSGSGKINSLFNLIRYESETDKIYFYAKNPYEGKYHFF